MKTMIRKLVLIVGLLLTSAVGAQQGSIGGGLYGIKIPIPASNLVGTDIATVGTVTTGAWNTTTGLMSTIGYQAVNTTAGIPGNGTGIRMYYDNSGDVGIIDCRNIAVAYKPCQVVSSTFTVSPSGVDKFVVNASGINGILGATTPAAITGTTVTASAGNITGTNSSNAGNGVFFTNATVGAAAVSKIQASADTAVGGMFVYSSSFTTSAFNIANSTVYYGNGAGGVAVVTGASAPLSFWTTNLQRGQFAADGTFNIGSGANLGLSNGGAGILQIGTGAAGSTAASLSATNYTTAATSSTGTAAIIDGSNVIRPLTSAREFKDNITLWQPNKSQLSAFISNIPIRFDYKDHHKTIEMQEQEHIINIETGATAKSLVPVEVGEDRIGVKNVLGFDADSLHEAGLVDMINYKDGKPYSVREHAILAYQQVIIQELNARLEALEKKMEGINAANDSEYRISIAQ